MNAEPTGAPQPRRPYRGRNGSTPTVLLVHGAFTDLSIWAPTIRATADLGADRLAVANPLRDLAGDAEHVAAISATIDGPVVLVGHGYGGAVISVAAVAAHNVVGLAYVAGLALDAGESCVDLLGRGADEVDFAAALSVRQVRLTGATVNDLTVDPTAFRAALAGDLPAEVAAAAALAQRPVAAAALEARPAAVAWRDVPTWYLVAASDRFLAPGVQRALARRAGATTTSVPASHLVPLSRPEAVADLIRAAVQPWPANHPTTSHP